MRPLRINKYFHVILNNIILTDSEHLTEKKKKCIASFSISHYSFYCLHTEGYRIFNYTFNKHVFKAIFLSLMILIFSHIFFHGTPQTILAYIRRELTLLATLSPTTLCPFKADSCIQLSCSMRIITQGDTKCIQN